MGSNPTWCIQRTIVRDYRLFCGKMIGSNNKLTDKINDREVYMKEIDHSYYYEGYSIYKAEDL